MIIIDDNYDDTSYSTESDAEGIIEGNEPVDFDGEEEFFDFDKKISRKLVKQMPSVARQNFGDLFHFC